MFESIQITGDLVTGKAALPEGYAVEVKVVMRKNGEVLREESIDLPYRPKGESDGKKS